MPNSRYRAVVDIIGDGLTVEEVWSGFTSGGPSGGVYLENASLTKLTEIQGLGPVSFGTPSGGYVNVSLPEFTPESSCTYQLQHSDDEFYTFSVVADDLSSEDTVPDAMAIGRSWRLVTIGPAPDYFQVPGPPNAPV